MIFILSENSDPYFNLAAEEYLLKNSSQEVFMLWRCDSAVIVGKHQNALAEINYPFVKNNNIKVARRLTGGGTVYHDQGNINFTFIRKGEKGKLVDFKKFISPIIEILRDIGIAAESGLKNEILLEGKKISGNAEHIFKSRILHHGTLLFNSELSKLKEALKVNPGKYHDKSVQSNRSDVTNINKYLHKKMSVEEFIHALFTAYMKHTTGLIEYNFNEVDLMAIKNLVKEKYGTWEWIFGYSPKYKFENSILSGKKQLDILLNVENGIIKSAGISGNYFPERKAKNLANALINQKHNEEQIKGVIESLFHDNIPVSLMADLQVAFF